MQRIITKLLLVCLILFSFTSCELAGGIFKAGMGAGIFIVILIIAILIYALSKIFGRKN